MERCSSAAAAVYEKDDLHLRLGLPGRDESEQPSSSYCVNTNTNNKKRSSLEMESSSHKDEVQESAAPPPKAQVVGWPPVRSYRKNALQPPQKRPESEGSGMFVKVSLDGAPYLRKIDLKFYKSYSDLLKTLEAMFKCTIGYNGSELAPTYEDRDGDWMLVGDVPWEMFITSCKRFRIMKASEAKGFGRFP